MLYPDYFEGKADRLLELYRGLEDFAIKDIARRILAAGELTATADRLLYRLQQAGLHRDEIERKLAQITKLGQKELRKILQEAVIASWKDDKTALAAMGEDIKSPLSSPHIVRIMDAEYKKSLGELENLTRTTMSDSYRDLIQLLDQTELTVAYGIETYSQAACRLIDQYASNGLTVTYPTGTRRTLESAVRLCVVTAMNQTAAQVTNQYIVDAGVEYVLVSAHLGARVKREGQPDLAGHDLWQGKAYKITGSEPGYPNLLESTGYNIDPVTGAGAVVNPLGLHGYNCRHSHQPWDKTLRNPWVDENGKPIIDLEESRERYRLSQHQRSMERAIRRTERRLVAKKEQVDAITDPEEKNRLESEYAALASRWTKQNKAYNDYCKDNGLQPQYDRTKAAGFGAAQKAAANTAAKRYSDGKEQMDPV